MSQLSHINFIRTMPDAVRPHLPPVLQQSIQVRQPFRWIIQFHFGEPRLHYEISRVGGRKEWELAFHCEAKDHKLNKYLLYGFRRHLFEIKDVLGPNVEAEMWDKGWTKIYDVYPDEELNEAVQAALATRLAAFIVCLHPIYVDLRNDVKKIYR